MLDALRADGVGALGTPWVPVSKEGPPRPSEQCSHGTRRCGHRSMQPRPWHLLRMPIRSDRRSSTPARSWQLARISAHVSFLDVGASFRDSFLKWGIRWPGLIASH